MLTDIARLTLLADETCDNLEKSARIVFAELLDNVGTTGLEIPHRRSEEVLVYFVQNSAMAGLNVMTRPFHHINSCASDFIERSRCEISRRAVIAAVVQRPCLGIIIFLRCS